MGLDMYLNNNEGEEIGYWRKANAIHGWFVRECAGGVDECQPISVSRAQLEALRNDVVQALAQKPVLVAAGENHGVIEMENNPPADILSFIMDNMKVQSHEHEFNDDDDTDPLRPTRGFFFGSYEKDEWYYQDLEETLTILNSALESQSTDFTYQASW